MQSVNKMVHLANVSRNLLCGASTFLRDKLGLNIKPKYLWFEVTDRCNSKCQPCNIWRQKPTPDNECLSPDELQSVLSDPLMKNVGYVLNSGGECTLVDLKAYLRAENMALPKATLQISSNGLRPTVLVDAVKYAVGIGVPTINVGLSIDGIGVEHDAVRGVKGNFERLMIAVDELQELQKRFPQISLSWGSTLTDVTAKQADVLYKFSEELGIPFMWHWYNQSSFYKNSGSCGNSDIKNVVNDFPSKYIYWSMWQKNLRTGLLPKFKCFALKTFLALHCNGDVSPCLSKWNISVGNVKETSMSKIWNGYKARFERRNIKSCHGCLNSWGVGWSINSVYYPKIVHRLKYFLNAL